MNDRFTVYGNLARPEGNVTGVTFFADTMTAKRLELVRELVPDATIGVLVNPNNGDTPAELREVEAWARQSGQEVLVLRASTPGEIDAAFATIEQRGAGAVVIAGDPMFTGRRQQISALVARQAIPTIFSSPDVTPPDALASYGASLTDSYNKVGTYVGKISRVLNPQTSRSCGQHSSGS